MRAAVLIREQAPPIHGIVPLVRGFVETGAGEPDLVRIWLEHPVVGIVGFDAKLDGRLLGEHLPRAREVACRRLAFRSLDAAHEAALELVLAGGSAS